jgi:hypothetical protein
MSYPLLLDEMFTSAIAEQLRAKAAARREGHPAVSYLAAVRLSFTQPASPICLAGQMVPGWRAVASSRESVSQ